MATHAAKTHRSDLNLHVANSFKVPACGFNLAPHMQTLPKHVHWPMHSNSGCRYMSAMISKISCTIAYIAFYAQALHL